jgi:hypothetical protein
MTQQIPGPLQLLVRLFTDRHSDQIAPRRDGCDDCRPWLRRGGRRSTIDRFRRRAWFFDEQPRLVDRRS